MQNNPSIKRLLAAVMLLIFTLSITPKKYLHDLFAGHKDIVEKAANDGKVHFNKTGYQCDCNSLVATSPFTDPADDIHIPVPAVFSSISVLLTDFVYSSPYYFIELRGPPAV